MKDNNVVGIQKLLNISDYNVKPFEIGWNKVKMTSSKWITCCHRRSVQSESNHSSPLFTAKNVRNSTPNGKFHPPPPAQPQSLPYKPSRQDILRSSTSSNYSLLTQSTSPASSLSVYDLGRKSSSISSSSSSGASTSSTLNNDHHHQHHRLPVMKHSASTYDLSSPRRYAQNLRNQLASHHPHDDSLLNFMAHSIPITVQNTITIINPLECFLINCETNDDTKSAQISPDLDVIAVANDYWLAFYSIRTNNCLGMVQFPDKCRFWTWVRPETIALVTENDVYHWRLTNIDCRSNYIQKSDSPHYVFSVDENIKQSQIINYSIDPIFGYWCALSTLFIDDDGEIGGNVQIYSHSHGQSQCIEAHSCTFVSYKYEDSAQSSILLVAAKRENNQLWKLHIIELGPIPNGNTNHRIKTQQLMQHSLKLNGDGGGGVRAATVIGSANFYDDIPTNIVCDNRMGLIYLLSKYGSFYICDIESGVPLHYHLLSDSRVAYFSLSLDERTNSLVALARDGQVSLIKVKLTALIEDSANSKVQSKVFERISRKLKENEPNLNNNNNNNSIVSRYHEFCVNVQRINSGPLSLDSAKLVQLNNHPLTPSHCSVATIQCNSEANKSFDNSSISFEEEVTRL